MVCVWRPVTTRKRRIPLSPQQRSSLFPVIPFLGLRTMKTVAAVFVSALFMKYVLNQSPFFACIGAVVAVERTLSTSLRAALIRNIGTLTGGVVGIAISSFTENVLLISLGLIPMICVDNLLDKKESIVPGAIVYFAVAYLNTMSEAWVYGVKRIIGTFIGTLIGLAINALIFPPKLMEDDASDLPELE